MLILEAFLQPMDVPAPVLGAVIAVTGGAIYTAYIQFRVATRNNVAAAEREKQKLNLQFRADNLKRRVELLRNLTHTLDDCGAYIIRQDDHEVDVKVICLFRDAVVAARKSDDWPDELRDMGELVEAALKRAVDYFNLELDKRIKSTATKGYWNCYSNLDLIIWRARYKVSAQATQAKLELEALHQ